VPATISAGNLNPRAVSRPIIREPVAILFSADVPSVLAASPAESAATGGRKPADRAKISRSSASDASLPIRADGTAVPVWFVYMATSGTSG
jgi:hypothetical protein